MRYYCYRTNANDFATFKPPDEKREWLEAEIGYGSAPLAPSWSPIQISYEIPERHSEMEDGDFPTLDCFGVQIPLFSTRAWEILSGQLECQWEPLPVIHPRGKGFYIIHVMEALDCIDLERSEVARYTSGDVMQVERFWLKDDLLAGKHVFKIPPGKGRSLLLLDDVFREVVKEFGLKGLTFRRIPMVSDPAGGPTMRELELFPQFYNEEGEPLPEKWKLHAAERPQEVKHKEDRPLDPKVVEEIHGQIELAMHNLEIDATSPTPDEIQQRVYEQVNYVLDQRAMLSGETVDNAILQLGCLWGQSVCDALGWEWATVTFDDDDSYGIVSPTRSHVVFPLLYFKDLLTDPEGEPNCLLLYNMLKGDGFSSAAREYSVLG